MVNHLEALWKGVCTITVRNETVDPVTKRTVFLPEDIVRDEPCRISFKTFAQASESGTGNKIVQIVSLFLASDISVPAGSKITVTQNGRTNIYKNSGVPAVFSTHQEITLELFEGWA
ncbi:MAG: hypothetical protein Q8865_05500 [Bacillota bacterium]|nr:hypothetical protein [Bacillota bacterium]